MRAVRVLAPAKINLTLRVMAKEDNGYHQLETVFQSLDVADEVAVRPRGQGVHLTVVGAEPCPPRQNLAYRAADAFLAYAGIQQGIDIHLVKRIPAGGGMGGGSSDAAAVLRALNTLFEGEIDSASLSRIAADLGADVPFFLSPSPLTLAWGRGDRLFPLASLPPVPVLLAIPAFGVSTPAAFAALDASATGSSARSVGVLSPQDLSSWTSVAECAHNDFEDPVLDLEPRLVPIRSALESTDPQVCLLSGSGSTIFALYRGTQECEGAANRLRSQHPDVRWLTTATAIAVPDVIDGAAWPAN